jgi:hypothetical protein
MCWEAYPATGIISRNFADRTYLVARRGLPLHRYGEVPIAEAHMARNGQGEGGCPVSDDMISEFEGARRKFDLEVHDRRLVDPRSKCAPLLIAVCIVVSYT